MLGYRVNRKKYQTTFDKNIKKYALLAHDIHDLKLTLR